MFSGIIQDIGVVMEITGGKAGSDKTFWIHTHLPLAKLKIGASIACDGACLSVIETRQSDNAAYDFAVEVSSASFAVTKLGEWDIGSKINLEPALTLEDGIDGHLVSGHIDGVARLSKSEKDGGSLVMRFEFPRELSRLIAKKGSVTLDGVALTVNQISSDSALSWLECNIISHTAKVTNFGEKLIGAHVNIEVDLVARYLERLLLSKSSEIS